MHHVRISRRNFCYAARIPDFQYFVSDFHVSFYMGKKKSESHSEEKKKSESHSMLGEKKSESHFFLEKKKVNRLPGRKMLRKYFLWSRCFLKRLYSSLYHIRSLDLF